MRLFQIYVLLAVTVSLLACKPTAGEGGGLDFDAAWVRALPPGQPMTAAYGVLTNKQSDALTLRSFASDQFADVSLHRTTDQGGVSRMRPVDEIKLRPGESIALEPGGLHLMLMAPSADVSPGDHVRLSFIADTGVQFEFSVAIEMR